MTPFIKEKGVAAPLLAHNIDTDVIMPKQFLKGIDRDGLARGVMFDQRFDANGQPNPDFILNQPAWQDSSFLVVGDNFGCGSSREHAVWGLQQIGIKAIIGTSFAGIFYDNCQRNGVLLIQLEKDERDQIGRAAFDPAGNKIEIDLEDQRITLGNGTSFDFEIDPLRKDALIKGLDAVGSTLEKASLIKAFEVKYLATNPWLAD